MTAVPLGPGPHGARATVRRESTTSHRLLVTPFVWVLTLLLGAGLLALTPSQYAAAADPDEAQQVTINFSSMDPALPDRNATISLTGTITNTASEPLSGVQAIFWRDQSPITDSDSLSSALTSPATQPWGSRVFDKAGAFSDLTSEGKPTIAPGETVPFRVQARVADLELPRTAGAYLIGVHLLGRVGRKANATLGRGRLLVPIPSGSTTPATTKPVPMSTVVILSSRPAMIAPGRFTDDHLAEELAGGGRLQLLLEAAQRSDVSYAIDPALLEALTSMAAGYQVIQPDQTTAPGAGQQLAQNWLSAYGSLNVLNGFRIPFAAPDLNGLAHQGLAPLSARIKNATDRIEQTRDLPVLGYSSSGQLAPEAVDLAEQFGPRAILASNARSGQTLLQPLKTAPLVRFDPTIFDGGPGPDPRTTSVHQRQRLLAESFVTSLSSSQPTTVRVVSTADQARADLASDAPWLQRVTLQSVLESSPREWSGDLNAPDRTTEMPHEQADELGSLNTALDNFADLLVDPAAANAQADGVVARGASGWWRGDQQGFDAFTRPQVRELRAVLGGSVVTMNVQRSVIMSGQSGSFPMTLTNQLAQPVRVNIHFESDQPQRLSIPVRQGVVIQPRESVTVNIQPRAVGNGPVRVQAWLSTPDNTPIGRRTALTVNATNLGFVGWIIVIASGIVLLGATFLRIRQVRRERASAHAPARAYAEQPGDHPTLPVVVIDPLPDQSPVGGPDPENAPRPSDPHTESDRADRHGTEEAHERG